MQIVFSRVLVSGSVRAIRFEADGSVKLVQLPNPQSGPEDVVVQVLAAGVCHTDLHLLDEVKAGEREPLIPGHEIVGRVSKIGADVYASSVGDRVVVHFEQPCGQCRQCRRKRTNLCEKGHSLGFDAPGGYAEFVVVAPGTESVSITADDLVEGGRAYLGSSSSTMADLARVIALAEAGRLRPVVTRKAPLEDAPEVLGDLRSGRIVGRAVLFPGPMDP